MTPCASCDVKRIVLYRLGERLLCRRCYVLEREASKRRHMK